jgi:hypothetical protein
MILAGLTTDLHLTCTARTRRKYDPNATSISAKRRLREHWNEGQKKEGSEEQMSVGNTQGSLRGVSGGGGTAFSFLYTHMP